MNFVDIQPTVRNLIAGHATFSALAASTVFQDVGFSRPDMEKALDISSTPAGAGYSIAVWPPARGNSDSETSGISGCDSMIVVRFEVSPKKLAALAAQQVPVDPSNWMNTRIKDIINAVLSAAPDVGGVKFQLAADAFELVNFDEGLVAYHIRFSRFAVFGEGI